MILSISDLRRWCGRYAKRGKGRHHLDTTRELAMNAFFRFLGWKEQEFYKWLRNGESIPPRVQRTMSKFVADWEAGYLVCTPFKAGKKREIVRLTIPKRRTRMVIHISASGTTLSFLPRPQVEAGMPSFRDLIRPNLRNRTS